MTAAAFDFISAIGFGVAIVFGLRIRPPLWDRASRLFFVLSACVMALVGLSNALEHSGLTSALDPYEDYLELFYLPFFMFFILSMHSYQEIKIRAQAEEALRAALNSAYEEKERSEAVIAAIGDSLTIQDRNFKIIFQNGPCKADWGEHPGEFCYKIYEESDRICDDCGLALAFQDGKVHRIRKALLKKGRSRHVEITASPLKNSRGELVGGVELVRDITDQKRMEEDLRASVKLYRLLFESNPHPMWVYDLETLGFLAVNDAAIRHYGYSREDFLSMTIKDIRPPEDIPRLIENVSKVTDGLDEAGIWRHIKKDGSVIDVEITSHTLDFGGRRAELVLALDVTERRRLEAEARKAQRLESLGMLAGGLAHDFNNLLTGIIGNISLANLYAKADSEVRERLIEAEKAAFRARDLTQQLLTFSRGGAPIKKTSSLRDLIRDSVSFALSGRRSKCEFEIPDDLWHAELDEAQIGQVIYNIILNADQAMPEGGTIRVACENTVVSPSDGISLRPGRYVKISIADRGVGIQREHIGKIFDPYFTTKQRGRGLGLAISYSIVKRHEGYIYVESEKGKGSVFHVYLPASDKRASYPETRPELKTGRGRVLLMDDEETVRAVASAMLGSLGYEVEAATDGAEAIELFKKKAAEGKPFDLVILDLTVPGGMGGKETLQRLREMAPNIKAVVSSGYSNDPIMSDFEAYGFNGVIAKPYTMESLSQAIHSVAAPEKR